MSSAIESCSSEQLPKHVAVTMDGNGRWARARGLPNTEGHKAGVEPLRMVIQACGELGIQALTVFAFSTENWKRSEEEVSTLMSLFIGSLTDEVEQLHEHSVQLRVIGARNRFAQELLERMEYCENLTRENKGLVLTIAADFGGRWDITQASQKLVRAALEGDLKPDDITEATIADALSNHDLPDPDLCIRTGGEQRISNFLLWQFAYTELVVNKALWPDYSLEAFHSDLLDYVSRERRFGKNGEL